MKCLVEFNGELVSRAEYCRKLDYNYNIITSLMHRHKISFEKAIERYLDNEKKKKSLYLNGDYVSAREYCKQLGYSYNAIRNLKYRNKLNWHEAIDKYLQNKKNRRTIKDMRLRNIWVQMMERCYNPKHNYYKYYGGRGIKVQESWHKYFNFEDDTYNDYIEHCEKYGVKDTTIDRFPNKNGNYEITNIRWATIEEQANNKNNNHMITDDLTMAQVSKRYNLSYSAVQHRLERGWTVEKILNTPMNPNIKNYLPCGTLSKHCKLNNYNYDKIRYIAKRDSLTIDKALEKYLETLLTTT